MKDKQQPFQIKCASDKYGHIKMEFSDGGKLHSQNVTDHLLLLIIDRLDKILKKLK